MRPLLVIALFLCTQLFALTNPTMTALKDNSYYEQIKQGTGCKYFHVDLDVAAETTYLTWYDKNCLDDGHVWTFHCADKAKNCVRHVSNVSSYAIESLPNGNLWFSMTQNGNRILSRIYKPFRKY